MPAVAGLRDFNSLKPEVGQAIHMQKLLLTAQEQLKIGWHVGCASGNHQGRVNSMSRADKYSDTAGSQLCNGGDFNTGTMTSMSTPVWEKAAPELLT